MKPKQWGTEWPNGFQAWTRDQRFRDLEELLLWDAAQMIECRDEALAMFNPGTIQPSKARPLREQWLLVRDLACFIALERMGRPIRWQSIRWASRLSWQIREEFLALT